MDIPALKQQARALEQQGSVDDALEKYRQILAELEAIGGVRQELPLLIKIGDLLAKSDDADGAAQMYERAAAEYALQGSAQSVVSLCDKILRAAPHQTGAYLRLARRLLDAGHVEGCRQVLIDYAQRGQLGKTREGLELLAGRPDEEVRRRLDKAIFTAERRLARRPGPARQVPRAAAPAAPPLPGREAEEEPPSPHDSEPEPEEEPEPEPDLPGPPRRRLTVPVGAMDDEPTTQPNPSEATPEAAFPSAEEVAASEPPAAQRESRPQDAFPTAEDLQAPVLPFQPPPPAAEPEPPSVPPMIIEHAVPEPLAFDASLAPQPRDSEPALERPALPPEEPPWAPNHEGARHEVPPAPPEPAPPSRPPRVSQPQRRISGAHPRPARARRAPAPRGGAGRRRVRLWPFVVALLLLGAGVLAWRGVHPIDRLRHLFGRQEAAAPARTRPRSRQGEDSVMARDTAGFNRPEPARPAPAVPFAPTLVLPQMPVTLPIGVALSRQVYVVRGLQIESVTPDSVNGVVGYRIVQLLPPNRRIILEELPSDSAVAGEIGVTGIDPDTVVGHTGAGGLAVTLKGVISEDLVIQLLQQLVPVGP